MMGIDRRRFLALSAAFPAASALACSDDDPGDGWDRGPLSHLLPTASHDAFLIKASFRTPRTNAPRLRINGQHQKGFQTDTTGRFWAFHVPDLSPNTKYTLALEEPPAAGSGAGRLLCDPWPLSTLPAPNDQPKALRIGAFTCAGGINLPIPPGIFHAFKPAAYRRALFDRMLAKKPDLVVANGDHVYFDLPLMGRGQSHPAAAILGPFVEQAMAHFDPSLPVLGSANEESLKIVGDDQIASIYGVRFRSTPVFFITDDHDYFDNDDATPNRVTLPPDTFHEGLRNALQRLYFPEFIATDAKASLRPDFVADGGLPRSTHFGQVRYGDLFQGLFYDCGGMLELNQNGGLVPKRVEAWLLEETLREDSQHLIHFPSHPMGFTAGKWREWYPDILASSSSVVEAVRRNEDGGKFLWQQGWWDQHQRLVSALSAQQTRAALVVSGDLHALGALSIQQSGDLALEANPVTAVLSGPIGVGDVGWPSRARGVPARTPHALKTESLLDLDERNGFSLLDFDREHVRIATLGAPTGYAAPETLSLDRALDVQIPRIKLSASR